MAARDPDYQELYVSLGHLHDTTSRLERKLDVLLEAFVDLLGESSGDAHRLAALAAQLKQSQGALAQAVETAGRGLGPK